MKNFILAITLLLVGSMSVPGAVSAQSGLSSSVELEGFAWASTIGWISMSCNNTATCAGDPGAGPRISYGVEINPNGSVTGFAWSPNIGWIQFGGLSGFPTGTATESANANVIGTSPDFVFSGWARACAGASDPASCSGGTNANSGGWDGWISLSGADHSIVMNDGVVNPGASSYAWGGPNTVGWITFAATDSAGDPLSPVGLSQRSDISIDALSLTNSVVDLAGLYELEFSADVVGIPVGVDNVPFTLTLGTSTVTGTIEQTLAGPVFSEPLVFQNVPFTSTDDVVLEVDLPAPGEVTEDIRSTPQDEEVEGNILSFSFNLDEPAPIIVLEGPVAVRSGEPASITWSVSALYPVSCSFQGPGFDRTIDVSGALGLPDEEGDTEDSDPLFNNGRFEISCTVGSNVYTEVLNVEVIPTFQEI